MDRQLIVRIALAAFVAGFAALPAHALQKARFLTVEQGQGEFRADEILAAALSDFVDAPTRSAYGQVVQDVIDDADSQGIVARMTPYAFVVAEMRGAKLDLIATYQSKNTGRTMYNAYLVIRRQTPLARRDAVGPGGEFGVDGSLLWPRDDEPTLGRIIDALAARGAEGKPARFVYHKKLSTSSFFLPSLLFRSRRIFEQGEGSEAKGTTIIVDKINSTSSSDLVREVANGDADLASVWDGTLSGFQDGAKFDEYGRKVWFLKLPTDLPCDLLVATNEVSPEVRQGIRDRLETPLQIEPPLGEDASWDVGAWVLWSDANAEVARSALSVLRRAAAEPPSPVVVRVKSDSKSKVSESELEAVRQAIRLSGTEFVAHSEFFDYYKQDDVGFRLERIHDGAVRLHVSYDQFKVKNKRVEQSFDISFVETADLTRRVGTLIHSRLHRIRPLWLYQDLAPTVIRDVDFEVPVGARLPMMKINWSDPSRNEFSQQGSGELVMANADFNKFEFDYDEALLPPRVNGSIQFEPMGRSEYRVLLMRPTPDRMLFRALTVVLVLVFVLAFLGLVWDYRRTEVREIASPGGPAPSASGDSHAVQARVREKV